MRWWGAFLRVSVGTAISLGLTLNWSSVQLSLDDLLRAEARGMDAAERASAGQTLPKTPEATPMPGSSLTPLPTETPTVTPADTSPPSQTPERTQTPIVVPTETAPGSPTPTIELPPLPTPAPTIAPVGTVDEREITTAGGTITTADGRMTVALPPEAVLEPLTVRVTHRDVRQLTPMASHPFMTAWEFEAFATDRGMAQVDKFPANIQIIANYSEEDLEGRNPDTLRLWTWNEESVSWEALASTHIGGSGTVVAEVNHFSLDVGTADPAVIQPGLLRAYQTNLHTGASAINLPIDVPAGPGGLTPGLSLSYSSDRVNEMKRPIDQGSWLGIGWDMSMPSIRKEFNAFPPGTSRYFIDLNGVSDELVYGSDGTWRTKHNEFLKITQFASTGYTSCESTVTTGQGGSQWSQGQTPPTPPCSWSVTDKQGRTYHFGRTATAPDGTAARYYDYYYCDSGSTHHYKLHYYRWDLRQITDLHDNAVDYSYYQEPLNDNPYEPTCGSNNPTGAQTWVFAAYPTAITYGSASIAFTATGDGTYTGFPPIQLRNDSPRNLSSCHIPNKTEETRKLDSIDIMFNGARVRKYGFSYDSNASDAHFSFQGCNNPVSGKYRLLSMTQYATDGWSPFYTMDFAYSDKSFSCSGTGCPTPNSFSRPFLTSAKNGFGGETTFAYKNPPPAPSSGWSRQVVEQMTSDAGVAGVDDMLTTYSYSDGPKYFYPDTPIEYGKGEFRGFGQVTETRDTNVSTVHHFNTTTSETVDDWMTGRETRTEVKGPNLPGGAVETWRDTNYNWSDTDTYGGNSKFIKLTSVVVAEGRSSATQLTTNFDYDSFGNVICERQLGKSGTADNRHVYRPHTGSDSNWLFLPRGELVYQGESDGTACSSASSSNKRSSTAFFYDGAKESDWLTSQPSIGNITATMRSDLQPTEQFSVVYTTYDGYGNKLKESIPVATRPTNNSNYPSPAPDATEWDYSGTTSFNIFPTSITNPANHTTTLTWNAGLGEVTRRQEPAGNDVHFSYDGFGRFEKSWDSNSTVDAPTVHVIYYWDKATDPTSTTDLNSTLIVYRPFGSGITFESHCVDGFGRDLIVRRGFEGQGGDDSVVQTSYDRRGLPKYRTMPFEMDWQGNGWCLVGLPDESSQPRTAFAYNALDEVSKSTTTADAQSVEVKTDHDGLTTKVIDEEGHATAYKRDGRGRVIEAYDWLSTFTTFPPSLSAYYSKTQYAYDSLDNLTSVTDHQNHLTTMTYDGMGRKITMSDPDMGYWMYQYDVAGNLEKQTDARGQVIAMVYDDINRIAKKCYNTTPSACASDTNLATTYTYDTYGASNACDAQQSPPDSAEGRLTVLQANQNQPGANQIKDYFCYDVEGREVKHRRSFDGGATIGAEVGHTLDRDKLSSITYPGGEQVGLSYHFAAGGADGLPISLSGSSQYVKSQNTQYNVAGQLDQLRLGTDFTSQFSYYERGQLKRITTPNPSGNPTFIQDLNYAYDKASNVTSINDAVAGEALWFCYDHLDRLIKAFPYTGFPTACDTTTGTMEYSYDEIGNLTRKKEGDDWTLNYDASKPHFLASANAGTPARAYGSDSNGNVTQTTGSSATVLADSDGDGCPDVKEQQTSPGSEKFGGLRDYLNMYDYHNPTHDGKNRVDDILKVVSQYFDDKYLPSPPNPPNTPNPNYNPDTDRQGILGQNAWNLTMGNGQQRIDDVLASVKQYFHDCGPGMKLTYDEENHLRTISKGTLTATYIYDGQGGLAKKQMSDNTGGTLYMDGLWEQNGSAVTKYYWFDGKRVAMNQGGALYYLLSDHLGSTTTVLEPPGVLVENTSSLRYYPFGTSRNDGFGAKTDKKFTGHQKEGDFYYMGARFYDPTVGRFLQPDSIVPDPMSPQSLNRYSYVYNNPLRYADPSGHVPCPQAGAGLPCPTDEILGRCLLGMYCSAFASQGQPGSIPQEWTRAFVCEQYATCAPGESGPCTTKFCSGAEMVFEVLAAPVIDACSLTTGTTLCVGGDDVSAGGRAWAAGGLVLLLAGGITTPEEVLLEPAFPKALTLGRNAERGIFVYRGVRKGEYIYAGQSKNLANRQVQHGTRFTLRRVANRSVTRGQARAIEQALIVDNPRFENIRNSISPAHPYYEEALAWGIWWLRTRGR